MAPTGCYTFRVTTRLILIVLAGIISANAQSIARPTVPDEIKAPPDDQIVLVAHASGSQIYTCDGHHRISPKLVEVPVLGRGQFSLFVMEEVPGFFVVTVF
jgi:hypothetical protein